MTKRALGFLINVFANRQAQALGGVESEESVLGVRHVLDVPSALRGVAPAARRVLTLGEELDAPARQLEVRARGLALARDRLRPFVFLGSRRSWAVAGLVRERWLPVVERLERQEHAGGRVDVLVEAPGANEAECRRMHGSSGPTPDLRSASAARAVVPGRVVNPAVMGRYSSSQLPWADCGLLEPSNAPIDRRISLPGEVGFALASRLGEGRERGEQEERGGRGEEGSQGLDLDCQRISDAPPGEGSSGHETDEDRRPLPSWRSRAKTVGMICATVLEASTSAILARMNEVSARADLLEIRADAVPPGELDLPAVLSRRARPVLVTCRPEREGGLWRGDEGSRLALLREAATLGCENVDVEWDAARELGPLPESTRLVVSAHDFSGTVPRDELFARVRLPRAHIQKVAQLVPDARDGLDLLARALQESKPTIAIGMGFPGVATRLLAERAGAPWTYAAANPSAPAAPGQLSLDALGALVRGRRITRATKALGLLGKPVGHSRSPRLLNAVFGTLGIDAVYAWLETDSPEAVLVEAKKDAGWLGFSVTIPHKERAAAACDRLSKEAKATGAVNTVVRSSDGAWVGHNTDAPAVARALEEVARERGLTLAGLPVDLLGAGGAARASAFALKQAGARVTIFDRTPEKGARVARELGVDFGGALDRVRATGQARALVNATSVGMVPDVALSPAGPEAMDAHTIVADLVYTPEATRFLALAEACGAARVTGLELFVLQARGQLELWLGKHVASRVSDEWLAARARSG